MTRLSVTARFTTLADVLLAIGDDSLAGAERILALPLHHRPAAIKRAIATNIRLAAAVDASKVRTARVEFKSLVFPKAAKRVTRASADHTLRLSSGSSDSKSMRAFLANGGSIDVLPTRTSAGFKRSSKVRISGGSGVNSLDKSRLAHDKMVRASRSLR